MTTAKTTDTPSSGTEARAEIIGLPTVVKLPAVVPPVQGTQRKRPRRKRAWLLLLLLAAALGAGYWWLHPRPALPPGIAAGNGRLEADEIDIDTKFAGRIFTLFADEGDMVKPGQVVAVMDTRDLEATLKKDEALVRQARRSLDEANANLVQQQTQVKFTQQELDRTAPSCLRASPPSNCSTNRPS